MNQIASPEMKGAGVKGCPICADPMHRVPSDGTAIIFRCATCRAEIAKAMPRDNLRRRQSRHQRLCGREIRMTRQFWRAKDTRLG